MTVLASASRDLVPSSKPSAALANWMVLRTKPRQEKAVARFLAAAGSQFYLPLINRCRFVGPRKLRSQLPLFPGYIFLFGTLDEAYAAVSTKRVCQILAVPDHVQFEREIEQISLALAHRGIVELYPGAVVGRRCRVTRGPFIGIEGVVASRLGVDRLVLQVSMLGQGAALEIDIDLLEPIDE